MGVEEAECVGRRSGTRCSVGSSKNFSVEALGNRISGSTYSTTEHPKNAKPLLKSRYLS